jgi:hypothetical protein
MVILKWLDRQINGNRLFRRGVLLWACWLVTVVSLRATDAEVLKTATGAAGVMVTAIIGILATVIGFYQWHRQQDDKRDSSAD